MLIRADLHTHPLLNRYLLHRDPSRMHRRPPFFLFPIFNYLDYPRAHAAKMRLLLSVVYVLPLPWRKSIDQVERLVRLATKEAKRSEAPVRIVRTAKEVRAASEENALGLMYAVEGGHVLDGDEENVDRLADLGVRYLTLVHFIHSRVGGAAAVPFGGKRGLTDFGRRVVRRLYSRGIVADLSHTTEPTFWGAIEEAAGPVIASHSGAREYALRDRNLSADQARAIARTGGVIGVIFCPFYLSAWRIRGSLDDIVRNISYFAELAGPDHVTLGSDIDGGLWPPREIRDVRDFELLIQALSKAGFKEAQVENIMGENLVRMYERFDPSMEA